MTISNAIVAISTVGMIRLRRKATESLRRQRGLVSIVIGASAFTHLAYHKIVA